MKLSVIIPVYNEQSTLVELIKRIEKVKIEKEMIVVDDGSSDKTLEILKSLKKEYSFTLLTHSENQGKGAVVQTALEYVWGELVVIQDADLETDPNDYLKLVEPILNRKVKVVFTSRIRSFREIKPFIFKIYFLGAKFLTWLANILFSAHLTDINSGCKLFKTEVLKSLNLQSKGFNIDEEITAKILRRGYSLIEIPIHYFPRTVDEGKKVRLMDGLIGALTLIKYRFKD